MDKKETRYSISFCIHLDWNACLVSFRKLRGTIVLITQNFDPE